MTEVIVDADGIMLTITNCARCLGPHARLEMKAFTHPHSNCTHFAICPRLLEPILFCMLDTAEAQDARERANN